MSNNHTQKVYSVLDSLTQTELDQYIKDKDINLTRDRMFETLNRIRKPTNHKDRILQDINDNLEKVIKSYYDLGMAWIISFVLESFYDDKYKINDLKLYLHKIMDNDQELKEMVYESMKDW